MTEIEAKALALVNEVLAESGQAPMRYAYRGSPNADALHRAIEREEATEARHAAEMRELKERFSEALTDWFGRYGSDVPLQFRPFILPAPDPLVEAVGDALEAQGMGRPQHTTPEIAEHLRAAIEARGGKIVWEAGE